MNKKISLGAAIAFALIVAAAVFSVTMVFALDKANETLSALSEREQFYDKFSAIDREVRQRYFGKIDEKNLQDETSRGYLKGIGDPHAKYYTAEEYTELMKEKSVDVAGIGVKLRTAADGYLEIEEVYPDGPAYLKGIQKGSFIVAVGEEAINTTNSDKMKSSLEGPDGSQVSITVRTDGNDQYYDLVRRVIVEPSVVWEILPDTQIGYIRIVSFDRSTSNQFNRALKDIQQNGGRALVFDLRGNASTDLASAARILDRLVPAGPMVMIQQKDGSVEQVEMSDSNELAWPMVVIVNSETAGISEMFAQVLVDYDKAKIVGSQTAGEAVQLELIRLPDGSAVELTVAVYQSPLGKMFHEEGITPHYDVQLSVEDSKWHKLPQDKDAQLKKAIEVVTTS